MKNICAHLMVNKTEQQTIVNDSTAVQEKRAESGKTM